MATLARVLDRVTAWPVQNLAGDVRHKVVPSDTPGYTRCGIGSRLPLTLVIGLDVVPSVGLRVVWPALQINGTVACGTQVNARKGKFALKVGPKQAVQAMGSLMRLGVTVPGSDGVGSGTRSWISQE